MGAAERPCFIASRAYQKALTNSDERGIINTNEMVRRRLYSARENVKPVRDDVFNGLTLNARKHGADIIKCEYGDDWFLHEELKKR